MFRANNRHNRSCYSAILYNKIKLYIKRGMLAERREEGWTCEGSLVDAPFPCPRNCGGGDLEQRHQSADITNPHHIQYSILISMISIYVRNWRIRPLLLGLHSRTRLYIDAYINSNARYILCNMIEADVINFNSLRQDFKAYYL